MVTCDKGFDVFNLKDGESPQEMRILMKSSGTVGDTMGMLVMGLIETYPIPKTKQLRSIEVLGFSVHTADSSLPS